VDEGYSQAPHDAVTHFDEETVYEQY